MNNRRSGLGRGLDALIPGAAPPFSPTSSVQEIDVDLIVPNPEQPRTNFDPESLSELTQSIREHGVIQPLIVNRAATEGTYQLIAGERRLLASRQAGLRRVPVVIKEATGRSLLELALVENLQRADLGPLEEAFAFKRLGDEFGLTQESVASRVGRSRSSVANTIRLLALPPEIQSSLAKGEITSGHARAILSIESPGDQLRIWQRIVEGSLNVRQAEALTKPGALESKPTTLKQASPETQAVEEQLRSLLGTRVDLRRGRKGGQITIHFYSDEELDALIEKLS